MYVPDYYRPSDEDVRELLRHHGAVDLIASTPAGLRATMLPMIWVEPDPAVSHETGPLGLLRGHFARKNDQWRRSPRRGDGDHPRPGRLHHPAWYATKREHGRVVPTWNYITAHVYGDL